jgi:hypothetical protein
MSVGARKLLSVSLVSVCALAGSLLLPGAPALGAIKHPFVASFGSFTTVAGVAVDQSTGDVYVYDAGAEAIFKYTAAGVPAEFTSTKTDAITGVGGAGQSEGEIAVDSSVGPAKGDIYLAHASGNILIYNAAGEKVGELTEAAGKPWGEACGVAVDTSGDVYVGLYGSHVNKYVPAANPVTDADYVGSWWGVSEVCNVAADSAGNAFVDSWASGPVTRYVASQLNTLETPAVGQVVDAKGSTLAVNPGDDHVYVDEHTRVKEFGAHGEPFEEPLSVFGETGEGAIVESEGVAVDQTSGDVYVSDGKGHISVFGPGELTPTVSTGQATGVAGFSVTIGGSVNPEGSPVTECKFEYGTSGAYGQSVPCATSPGSGNGPVPVSAEVTGLGSGVTYHFRLVAANAAGDEAGTDETFTTAQVVLTGEASSITIDGATLGGSVNPEGLAVTGCKFEYGLTTTYGQSTPCAVLPGSGNEPINVTGTVTGLTPNGKYNYRLVITNANGVSLGGNRVLTTEGPLDTGLPGLPDGRVYELVTSRENSDFEVYEPESGGEFASILTEFPFQAAANGARVAYVGTPSVGGNESAGFNEGNQYLATRSSDNVWAQTNISPEGSATAVFEGFSSDLSEGFLDALYALSPEAPGFGEEVPPGGSYDVLYSTNTATAGGYAPAFTVTPPYRSKYDFESAKIGHLGLNGARASNARMLVYAGTSADSRHVLFEANDALTPEAEGGSAAHYQEENNLYEWAGGQLKLVNVLPGGTTKANATFGAPNSETINGFYASPDFSHVISTDGSRVFWTDLNTGHIYMRENGATTVEISPSGRYWTATADGSKVFYTNGDLYEYDVNDGHTTDLTPGVTVQGVIGASEDGDYVYYVTAGLDLDLWHDGTTSKIKTLTANDNGVGASGPSPYGYFAGDWKPGLGNRTAEVVPDGHGVVFMSSASDGGIGRVEVYDADTGQLYCASCGWGGSRGYVPATYSNTYLKRWISEDGSRVFFDSREALVPQDTNGRLDVYEWERPGSGGCLSSTGCIYLLSGGTSQDESYLADASANGNDVFIITRAQLSSQDGNEKYDLYDARVGGSEPVTPAQCTGTGCQGVPAAPPIFATPSSATFAGIGNFAVPAPVVKAKIKPKPKKQKPKPKAKHKHAKKRVKKRGRKASANSGRANAAGGRARSGGKGGRS